MHKSAYAYLTIYCKKLPFEKNSPIINCINSLIIDKENIKCRKNRNQWLNKFDQILKLQLSSLRRAPKEKNN